MKYDAKRNFVYPVLRPYSDDYLEHALATELTAEPRAEDNSILVRVQFSVSAPNIRSLVDGGSALCVAMLYCRDTLYREMLQGGNGSFSVEGLIDERFLRNNVEVHPAIVAADGISLPTDAAHPEYEAKPVSVGQWQPLATAETWHFDVKRNAIPLQAIFNLSVDDALPDGIFDIRHEPADRYITISANAKTKADFISLPNKAHKFPTVYLGALIDAMAAIKEMEGESAETHSEGWAECIKAKLKELKVSLGTPDDPGESLFKAAQLLLRNPLGELITEVNQLNGEEDDEC